MQVGILQLLPGWDASPSQGYPQYFVAAAHLYNTKAEIRPRTTDLPMAVTTILTHLRNESELSSHKSKNLHKIDALQERLMTTGRKLSSRRGDLDIDAIKRMEKEKLGKGYSVGG